MAKSSEARIFPWYLFLFFDGVLKILSIQGQALLKIYVKFARKKLRENAITLHYKAQK